MHQLEDLPGEVFLRLADFLCLADFVRLRAVSKATADRMHTLDAWWMTWSRRRGTMISSTRAYGQQVARALLGRPSQEGSLGSEDIRMLWSMPIWTPYSAQWTKIEPTSLEESSPEARSGAVLQRLPPAASGGDECALVLACGCAAGRLKNDVWQANVFTNNDGGAQNSKLWYPLRSPTKCVIRPLGRDSCASWIVKEPWGPSLRLFGGRLHVISRFIPLIAAFNRALCDCNVEATQRSLLQETASLLMATALQYNFGSLPNPAEYNPEAPVFESVGTVAEGGNEALIMLLLEYVHHYELIQDPFATNPLSSMQNNMSVVMLASAHALMEVVCSFYYAFSPSQNALTLTECEFEQLLYVAGSMERVLFVETNWFWCFRLYDREWSVCSFDDSPAPRSGHSIVPVFSDSLDQNSGFRYSLLVGGGSGKFLFEERAGLATALPRSRIRFVRENLMFFALETTYINWPLHTVHVLDHLNLKCFETVCTGIPCVPKARNGHSCCSLPHYTSHSTAHSLIFGGFDGKDESSEMWDLVLWKEGVVSFVGMWSFVGSEEKYTSIALETRGWKSPDTRRRKTPVADKWPPRRVDASLLVLGELVVLCGGYSTASFDDCWVFDPYTLGWDEFQQQSRSMPRQVAARPQMDSFRGFAARRPLARTNAAA
eukprot:gb/GECG01011942.1/.p1 GENE.gb/GECG01011942.1/~~gb/GECG01011942.1/.p1  ORF type:complete len:659 (+),score=38.58 gb/GECG01011942.1/:1-1977(+)